MTRVFTKKAVWQIDNNDFQRAASLLCKEILRKHKIDSIVAVARGGIPLGEGIANRIGVPLYKVLAKANASDVIWSEESTTVTVEFLSEFPQCKYSRTLIVDDICGSGRTITAVKESLLSIGVNVSASAVLCKNKGARISPDMWVWGVEDWVVFPWEEKPEGMVLTPIGLPEQLFSER